MSKTGIIGAMELEVEQLKSKMTASYIVTKAGMEFYDGKPIVYSLGNFWFNSKTLDTMLLTLRITGEREEPKIEVSVVPAIQKDCRTTILTTQKDRENLYRYLESISINVTIDEYGVVTQDDSE